MTDNTPVQICPACQKEYTGFPAVSRTDNATSICSPCGESQALEGYPLELWDLSRFYYVQNARTGGR
jgi:hypothetical protein